MTSFGSGVRAALTALALSSLAFALAQTGDAQAAGGIVVQGSGVVMGEPDVAVVTLGVDLVDADLAAALANANGAMAAVRQALTAGGVADADIQTSAFDVWREDVRDEQGNVTAARYHVSHSYRVTVRAMEDLGTLLPATIDAGANSVGGIEFSIADPSALRSRARAAAMEDARARAGELAAAAGVELGAPLSIEERAAAEPRPMADFARATVDVPVAGGQLAVRIDVVVRFAIP